MLQMTPSLRKAIRQRLQPFLNPPEQQKYAAVGGEETEDDAAGLLYRQQSWPPPGSWIPFRRALAIASVTVVLILVAVSVLSYRNELRRVHPLPYVLDRPVPTYREPDHGDDHYLHVIFPASHVNLDVCRHILSSSALGYPVPWMISWDPVLDDEQSVTSRTISRIALTEEFLAKLSGNKQAKQMVMLLDSPNSWFQLRPEVLMQRYYNIKAQETERLRQLFPEHVMLSQNIQPSILYSAQTDCPWQLSNTTTCTSIPEASYVSSSVDSGSDLAEHTLRYLNSGIAIGPLEDVLNMYRMILLRVRSPGGDLIDEHSIASTLYAEQTTWRSKLGAMAREARQETSPATEAMWTGIEKSEYGIFLDYAGELAYYAVGDQNEDDIVWTRHQPMNAASNPTPGEHMQVPILADEIAASAPPFWTVHPADGLPTTMTWNNLTLLTNRRTKSAPVLIQFGPDAQTALPTQWWTRLWTHGFARSLFTASARRPETPLAIVADDEDVEHRFWSPSHGRAGYKTSDQDFHKWQDICQDPAWNQELFADGLGTWRRPHDDNF